MRLDIIYLLVFSVSALTQTTPASAAPPRSTLSQSLVQTLFSNLMDRVELSILRRVYDEDSASTILAELNNCTVVSSSALGVIMTDILSACALGLPTERLFEDVVETLLDMYETCPTLSSDLVSGLDITLGALLPAASALTSSILGTDADDSGESIQRQDFNVLMRNSVRVVEDLGTSGVMDYSTAQNFMNSVQAMLYDLAQDYVDAVEEVVVLLRRLTIQMCDSLGTGS